MHERGDFARIAQLEESVWNEEHNWVDSLADERAADPQGLRVFVAEAGGLTVSAGWVRFPSETEFVTLWGGATLPAWRGRGIYRALVARRAKLAAERGRRYIEVDASDDSRPILERLGFVPVTTTTPYVWSPPVAELTGRSFGRATLTRAARAGTSETPVRQATAKRKIAPPARTPSAPTETATLSACEAPTPDARRAAVLSADLRRGAGRADRQRCRRRAGAKEEKRERDRIADAERAEKHEERDRTDEPAGGHEHPRLRGPPQ